METTTTKNDDHSNTTKKKKKSEKNGQQQKTRRRRRRRTTIDDDGKTKGDDGEGLSFSRDETILCLKDGFLYPAKIVDMKTLEDGSAGVLVHYQGWNKKYDEWVEEKESCRKLTEENKRRTKETGG